MKPFCYLLLVFLCYLNSIAQEPTPKPTEIDVNYFQGNIIRHSTDIAHLITGRPQGVIINYNRKTYGLNAWERRYNYPDWGFSLLYQDFDNEFVGDIASINAHYTFYLLKRKFLFRVGQGIALATNPFDIETNIRNNAFGSRLLSSTFFQINYKQQLFEKIGFQAGITLTHFSNGSIRAPNTGLNTIAFNFGVHYKIEESPKYIDKGDDPFKKERIHYNFLFSSGVNETDIVGLGQRPFYIFTAFADKRLSHKSSIQLGAEAFFSLFLIDQIRFEATALPRLGTTGDEDYRRIGVFVGHELHFARTSVITQVGYYAYYPFDFVSRVYLRAGLKRTFGKKLFGSVAIRAHGANAEALEFGAGIRL